METESAVFSRIIAWRGLWDKFSAPRSLGAYQRAVQKGCSFILDESAGGLSFREALNAGLFSPFTKTGCVVVHGNVQNCELRMCDYGNAHNIFLIEQFSSPPYNLFSLSPQRVPVLRGFYYPLTFLLDYSLLPELNNWPEIPVVMYESVDTILAIKRKHCVTGFDDNSLLSKLDRVVPLGTKFYKVMDMVEREFLLYGVNRRGR